MTGGGGKETDFFFVEKIGLHGMNERQVRCKCAHHAHTCIFLWTESFGASLGHTARPSDCLQVGY